MIQFDEFRKGFAVVKTTSSKGVDVYYVREKPYTNGRSIQATTLSEDAAEWTIRQIYSGRVRNEELNSIAAASSRNSGQL